MNYNEAYNKIIDAYFKDEIKPFNRRFCFCGTLSPNSFWGSQNIICASYPYTVKEYIRMEAALFAPMERYGLEIMEGGWVACADEVIYHPDYENILFSGMSNALDVLKQIHIERGEVIDETPVFTKRQLA